MFDFSASTNENHKNTFKEACCFYNKETIKLGGKSTRIVCKGISRKYNTTIAHRTVQYYVQNNMAGESPKKRGPDGGINKQDFKILTMAYERFIRIKQLNPESGQNTCSLLLKRVNKVMKTGSSSDRLLQRLQKNWTIDFTAGVGNPQEEWRHCWTTYSNINCWFENWEKFPLDFGFASIQEDGTLVVPEDHKACILNLDETALTMDGSTQTGGGRPTVTFYDGSFQVLRSWVDCFKLITINHFNYWEYSCWGAVASALPIFNIY